MPLFSTPRNICTTVFGVQHQVALPDLASISWQRPPSTWTSTPATASTFFSERCSANTIPPSHSPQASPAANILFFFPPAVSCSLHFEPVPAASLIVSAAPVHFPPVISATTVWDTQPVSTVPEILAGISPHTPTAMVCHISFPVSFTVPTTAIASSIPAFPMISFSASMSVYLASAAVRQFSPESAIVDHQSPAAEPVASDSPSFSTVSYCPSPQTPCAPWQEICRNGWSIYCQQKSSFRIGVIFVSWRLDRSSTSLSGRHFTNLTLCCPCQSQHCTLFCCLGTLEAQHSAYWLRTIGDPSGWIFLYKRQYSSPTGNRAVFHLSFGFWVAL